MPKYFYTAKSFKGKEKSGTLFATNKYQLARTLREQGYILISAVLKREKRKRKFEISIPFLGRVGLKEKIFFTRNLQVMISAGVSLPKALATLAEQARSKKFKKILLKVKEDVTKGKTFSETLVEYPDVFSELFQNMIKVGEESGTLDEVLKTLTQQMEKEADFKSQIIGAMIYPAVVILAMIGIGLLMLMMVVPKLAETFKELNVELPMATKLVIGSGTFLAEKWYFVILIVIFLLFLLRQALKTESGKRILDKLTLKTPIVSPIIKKTNSAYTVRTLSSLIKAGVPIVRSLEILARTLPNIYFKEAIRDCAEKVRKGEKLSEALKIYQNIYPPLVVQMITVGEETGETSNILEKLAYFFEEEVSRTTKNLSSIIEPVILILVGAAVGFFAISMIQPMYSMLQAVK